MNWIKAGDRVAVLTEHLGPDQISIATVRRVTDTQIIVVNQGGQEDVERYNRSTGMRIGASRGRSAWTSPTHRLISMDHPMVKEIRTRDLVHGMIEAISKLEIPDGVEESAKILDTIEAMVGASRRKLASL